MSSFSILGRAVEAEDDAGGRVQAALADAPPIVVREKARFELGASLRSQGVEHLHFEAAEDDVVEVVLESEGERVRRWMSVARLREEYGDAGTRGGGATQLSARLRSDDGPRTRGAVKWVLKGLSFFGIDVAGRAARTTLDALARRIEGTLESGGEDRLYRLRVDGALHFTAATEDDTAGPEPLLVFLHGTFSSTRGSFGDLFSTDTAGVFRDLLAGRDGRVYGFEHRTLTASPIDNALALATQLPAGARLELVSHSRGGLVGEYLARACAMATRPEAIDRTVALLSTGAASHERRALRAQAGAFRRLCTTVRRRDLRVERFVRVACPANGTALASERIDDLLSTVLNLMDRVPGLGQSQLFDLVQAFLFALIKEKADPNLLPGIQAMNPRSRLIAALNDGGQAQGELIAIAGDTDGERALRALLMKGVDWLFGSDNDLVVNTPSMIRGSTRIEGAAFQREFGGGIHHLNYFSDAGVVALLAQCLQGRRPASLGAIGRLSPSPGNATRGLFSRRPTFGEISGERPLVYVVPGVLGSHLGIADADGGYDRIWLDFSDILLGRFTELRLDSGHHPRAIGVFDGAYGDLMEHLSSTHDVVPFPFDWRLDLRGEARRLAHRIREDRARAPEQPVRFVAHSMGGLLVRALMAYREDNGGVWEEVCRHPGSRFVMLGTPTRGSYSAFEIVLARERMVRMLATADLVNDVAAIQDMARRFPGVLQLLPRPDGEDDFHDAAFWAALHRADAHRDDWRVPEGAELRGAADFHARLAREERDGLAHIERISYVAGKAEATPVAHRIDADHADGVVVLTTAEGDGRVPWATGIPDGVTTYYVNASHGDLADTASAFAGIGEILQAGQTDLLPRFPTTGVLRSGAAAASILEERRRSEVLFPDAVDLASAALGRDAGGATPVAARVRVGVRHGDLRYSRNIVVVGHYQGDTIISAERALDATLGGALQRASDLGVYPGAPGSARYVSGAPGRRPPGGLVVGLGYVGELTPRRLRRNLRDALLRLALELESGDGDAGGAPARWQITPLLIGTGAGGIAVDRSVGAILGGVLDANEALRAQHASGDPDDAPGFEAVEFLDLFADRALEAAHALERLARSGRYAEQLDVVPVVGSGDGGLTRVSYAESAGWWQRLQVTDDGGMLEYSLLTDRSLVPERLVATEVEQVLRLSEQFRDDIAAAPGRGKTLFEMLLPPEFKAQVPDQEGVLLMLDPAAARLPWEMLDERSAQEREAGSGVPGGERRPLAVRVGLLRQLKLDAYPAMAPRVPERVALVVGDPELGDVALPQLDGARREAQDVASRLEEHGIHTRSMVGSEADTVLDALFDRTYKILHLAGHGVCDVDEHGALSRAGMVLGDGTLFASHHVNQLPGVPDLVFINCCHLGALPPRDRAGVDERYLARRSLFASNLATAFMRRGARAVVAAGWEVSDAAAAVFATAFYDRLLDGETFGEAVRAARSAAFEEEPHLNTWGAYQCYGDQDFRFDESVRAGGGPPPPLLSPAEACVRLEGLRRRAASPDAAPGDQRATIDALMGTLPVAWAGDAQIHATAGRAYGADSDWASAIAQIERARALESASCTLADLEQLANYRTRLAQVIGGAEDAGRDDRRRARALLREAQEELGLLLRLGETAERLSLLGAVHKRRLQIAGTGRPSERELGAMTRAYWNAYECARSRGYPDPYPLLSALAGMLIARWSRLGIRTSDDTWPADIEAALTQLDDALARSGSHEGLWHEMNVLDAGVIRHLVREDLGDEDRGQPRWERLATEYVEVLAKGDSRQRDSTLNQLAFIAAMLGSPGRRSGKRRASLEALARLIGRLAGQGQGGAASAGD